MGFIQAKSKPSLFAGVGLGACFLISGLIISKGKDLEGHGLALAASLLTIGGTAPRAIKTQKVVPAAVALLGLGSAIYQAKKVDEWR